MVYHQELYVKDNRVDRTDEQKIIRALKRYSKENIGKIAKRCGFSYQRTLRIIKKLEKDKTIWGYTTVIDEGKIDLKKYVLLIKRTNKPLSKERIEPVINGTIKEKFNDLGVEIDFILYVNGCYDFALCATSENIRLIKRFYDLFPKYIIHGSYLSGCKFFIVNY